MKIAICGSGKVIDDKTARKAYNLGKLIAERKYTLLMGGCKGYPYEAAKGCFENKGKVIAISPAKDIKEHKERYNFPIKNFTEIRYTGLGIPERNIPLIRSADIIIILDGKYGTLNEFTIAMHEKKKVGILKTGKLAKLIPKIADVCDKNGEKDNIVYDKDEKKLIEKLEP